MRPLLPVKRLTIIVAFAMIGGLLGFVVPRVSAAQTNPPTELYDTAWDLVSKATNSEIETYFDHIGDVGFDGVWLSLMPLDGWGLEATQITGATAGVVESDGSLSLTPEHLARMRFVFDEAQRNDVSVTLAPMWGVGYVHGHWDDGACTRLDEGPLNADNAYGWGHEVGSAFRNEQSLARWLFGGDNFCNVEDGEIWSEMARGVRDAGSQKPIGYHTASNTFRHFRFSDEPWHQFFAIQTSHCTRPAVAESELRDVVENSGGKPVFAAELRYEAIAPDWVGCIHNPRNPVDRDDVADDVRAALAAGVDGIVYGHNERWQWGNDILGATGEPLASLGSPGEAIALELVAEAAGSSSTSTSTTTTSTTSTTTSTSTTAAPDTTLAPSTTQPSSTTTVLPSTTQSPTTSVPSTSPPSSPPVSPSTTVLPGPVPRCNGLAATIIGTADADVLVGTENSDVIVGLGGDDVIDGRGGNDVICGGTGKDKLLGGPGSDMLLGGRNRDRLNGHGGKDILEGGKGRDRLSGGGGADWLDGGNGPDKLIGGKGFDTCDDDEDTKKKSCEATSTESEGQPNTSTTGALISQS